MTSSKNRSTVFVVEDDEAICELITCLLETVGLSVKTYKNPQAFLDVFNASFEGCLVLDIRMPGMSGLDLYEALKIRQSTLPVIFLTGYPDVSMAVNAMKAGAFDFIVKPFNNQQFLDQIQRALACVPAFAMRTRFLKRLESLTPRENDVLKHLVTGKMNKEIAHALRISISTVELHRANLMEKLQVKNLAELIKCYMLVHQNLLP